jgi:hypothetical protein
MKDEGGKFSAFRLHPSSFQKTGIKKDKQFGQVKNSSLLVATIHSPVFIE